MPNNQPDPIQFVVTMTVKSPTSNPVDVTYYRGEDRVQALGALMTAATMDIRDMDMPESMRTTVLSVRMDILPVECSGKIPGNASVPYCHNNTGGCALHYPSGGQWRGVDALVSGNDVLVDGASRSPVESETPTQWAERSGLGVSWKYDEWRDHVKEFPDAYDEEPDECLVATLVNGRGDVFASLGCIDDPTTEYRAEVEANLIAEAYAEAHPKKATEN